MIRNKITSICLLSLAVLMWTFSPAVALQCISGSQSPTKIETKQIACNGTSMCLHINYTYSQVNTQLTNFQCAPNNCSNVETDCKLLAVGKLTSLVSSVTSCKAVCCTGDLCNKVALKTTPVTTPSMRTTSHAERVSLGLITWFISLVTCLLLNFNEFGLQRLFV